MSILLTCYLSLDPTLIILLQPYCLHRLQLGWLSGHVLLSIPKGKPCVLVNQTLGCRLLIQRWGRVPHRRQWCDWDDLAVSAATRAPQSAISGHYCPLIQYQCFVPPHQPSFVFNAPNTWRSTSILSERRSPLDKSTYSMSRWHPSLHTSSRRVSSPRCWTSLGPVSKCVVAIVSIVEMY